MAPAATGNSHGFRANTEGIVQGEGSDYVHRLKSMPALQRSPHLFRKVFITTVLAYFGYIFRKDALDNLTQDTADALFHGSKQTKRISFFISHSWHAHWFLKYLALLYHVNIRSAVVSGFIAWVASFVALLTAYDWNMTMFGGEAWSFYLVVIFVVIPVTVFFLVFFFGHVVLRPSDDYWLDKMCIHQYDTDMKIAGASAIPEIVANTDTLLILWDESYFERLWCCLEVAVVCAAGGGNATRFVMQPLWFAPWVLLTILTDCLSICIFSKTVSVIPMVGEFWDGVFGDARDMIGFMAPTTGIALAIGVAYMPCALPNFFSFRTKLENHEHMLKQLTGFRFDQCKCSVESDRAILKDLATKLFESDLSLGQDPNAAPMSPLSRFDFFVQDKFLEICSSKVGSVTRIPLQLSLLVFLPLLFESMADILNCDGAECREFAESEGYTSVVEGMLNNTVGWVLGIVFVIPLTYPIMLNGMAWASGRLSGVCLGIVHMIITMGSYFLMGGLWGAMLGVNLNSHVYGGLKWYTAAIGYYMLIFLMNYKLFWQKPSAIGTRQKDMATDHRRPHMWSPLPNGDQTESSSAKTPTVNEKQHVGNTVSASERTPLVADEVETV